MDASDNSPRVALLRSGTDLGTNRTGGGHYQALAVEALRKRYEVDVRYVYYPAPTNDAGPRRALRFAGMVRALRRDAPPADVYLLDRRTMLLFKRRPGCAYIGLNHHHPIHQPVRTPGRLFVEASARFGFGRVDVLVAVSRFWKAYFERMGVADVRVIYNAIEARSVSPAECDAFRRAHGLDGSRPVVYLGLGTPEKGAAAAYERLRHRDYQFVTSGPRRPGLPCLHLDLPYDDYLKLLSVATLSVNMSTLPEGWCRTAHEAMLMGTPVVGSGQGGMKELLHGGGQVVCGDLDALDAVVAGLLRDAEGLAARAAAGQAFAATFTMARFEQAWQDLVAEAWQRAASVAPAGRI